MIQGQAQTIDYEASGFDVSAATAYNYINKRDAAGLQKWVLSGSDAIGGSTYDDYLIGWSGNDVVMGNAGNDTILGGDGDDYLFGGDGSNSIDGGNGNDYVGFSGSRSDYTISKSGKGYKIISNSIGAIDTVVNVETFGFSDGDVSAANLITSTPLVSTYKMASSASSVNEGSKVSFTITTANVAAGTAVS